MIARPGLIPGLAPGVVLGDAYRIDALLARGSTSAVFRATHIELGTTHAIKILLPALAEDPDTVRSLIEEGRKLARLRHEAIVEYEGLFRDVRGLRYQVMEFVEGPSLAAILKMRRLEANEVLLLRDRLAEGLAVAHEQGIIHRNICPENIILQQGQIGRAKLIDFGMIRTFDADATIVGESFAANFAYASPEQFGLFGGRVDLRSDIYSLGLVLANCAIGFGKTLDMGRSFANVLAKRGEPPDLTPIPAELRSAIAQMVMPRPEDRPPSMRALPATVPVAAPLRTAVRVTPETAPSPAAHTPWRAIAAVATVAVALILVVLRSTLWPPSLATLKADLAAAASGYECAAISTQAEADGSVQVSGHVASAADLDRLRRAVNRIYGIGRVSFDIRQLDWPYCQVVDLLQSYTNKQPPETPTVALASGAAYTGEGLALAVMMPNFDGYVFVDYFVRQGQVLHLLPNGRDRLNIKPGRNRFVLGRPPNLTCWTLADNPGDQLITVIASSRPLFSAPLPEVENADAYLKSLQAGLAKARKVAAATLSFQLQPPPYLNPAALCPGT
jgi:serine/threonine protein kinase